MIYKIFPKNLRRTRQGATKRGMIILLFETKRTIARERNDKTTEAARNRKGAR